MGSSIFKINKSRSDMPDLQNIKNKVMQAGNFTVVRIQTLEGRPCPPRQIRGQDFYSNYGRTKLLTYEQTCKPTHTAPYSNGFLGAFLCAYDNHGDVKITPDDVWITIMLYFSKYVNDNAEQLRTAFVSHQGKKKLTVTTGNELSESQWDEFFTLMIEEIRKNTSEGVTQKFQANFSTTGRLQRVFSTAIVMNTFQKYFEYGRCIPMCGIQNVHFGGTLEDWKSVLAKTQALAEFDINGKMKRYVSKVSDILLQFIETYQGRVDLDFWNRVYNRKSARLGSGSTSKISGWIIHFFGYEEETQTVSIPTMDFTIEIDNKMTGIKKDVKLLGGFQAVSGEGMVFRPHLSFAIQDGPPK